MKLQSLATVVTVAAMAASATSAQTPGDAALAIELSRGGYVIVMRHAHAPEMPPSALDADKANSHLERQLDALGRTSAETMGDAMRRMRLPIGTVWSSPTYRARETARLAGFGPVRIAAELGDGGQSMRAADKGQAAWLRNRVNEKPRPGTDNVIVTQYPNISAAFGDAARGMKDGEALVFRPTPSSAPQLVGRIGIEQWPILAARLKERPRLEP
jgi:hypothetical protein